MPFFAGVLLEMIISGITIVAVVLLVQAVVRISHAFDRISRSLDENAIGMRSGPRP